MEWFYPFVSWLGVLLALACLLAGFRNYRRKRLSEALPTSRALGVFLGLVEIKGAAECAAPLTSHLAEAACVHYEWTVEEHWEHSTKDKSESGWTRCGEGRATVPSFYVKDATGAILVHPQGAELDPAVIVNRTCSPTDPLYYGKGPAGEVAHSTRRRRFVEKAIRLHGPAYVVGKARERKDIVAAEIGADQSAPLFLVSGRSESDVQFSYFWRAFFWTLGGLFVLVAGLVIGDMFMSRDLVQRRLFYVYCAAAYPVVWMLLLVWNLFNDLVGLRNRVREGRALIDVQLKRRHDLIPNLVRVVEALRDHERLAQEQLAALRAQLAATPPGKPGPDYHALKPVLIAVAEKYPPLTALPAFRNLQKELVETEQRVALARDYYNNIATHFNTRIEQFPERLVAMLALMRRFELLLAKDFERAGIKVEFAK